MVIGLVALIVLSYVILQLSLNVGDNIDIENAFYTESAKTMTLEAYVFREETVISSVNGGICCYFFDDGEKVAKNENILTTYQLASDAAIQEQINTLNSKIRILEKSSVSKNYSSGDISRMDATISERITDIITALDSNSLRSAEMEEEELQVSMNRRRAVLTAISGFEMQIDILKSEISRLQSGLSGSSTLQSAQVPGYFYSSIDGYEELFSSTALDGLTLEKYEKLYQSVPDTALLASAVGKLVTSSKWYITVEMDKREAYRLTNGKSSGTKLEVSFPYSGNKTVKMTLDHIVSQTNYETVVLVLYSDELPDGFNYSRRQTVRITEQTYKGLKIPVSALRVIDGATGIYTLDGMTVKYKSATVLYEENGYYICKLPDENNISSVSDDQLSLYDVVIVSGKNIYDGKIIS